MIPALENRSTGAKSRDKKALEYSTPPPDKPLPIPKIEFPQCEVAKLPSYFASAIDMTRYSPSYFEELKKEQTHYSDSLRVMTWNVLMKEREARLNRDHPSFDATQLWAYRVPRIAAAINLIMPDILGCQELYEGADYNQESDLYRFIGTQYIRYSVKSNVDGEHNTLFLKRDKFKIIHVKSYHIVGKTVVTMVVIYRQKKMVIINTHFSFEPGPREEQARFIATLVTKEFRDKEFVLFMVDGNFFPNNPSNVLTKAGWDGPRILQILRSASIEDAYDKSLFGTFGSEGTYTNDEHNADPFKGRGTPGVRLDRIFVSQKVKVLAHVIEPFLTEGKPPSDHQAVVAHVYIP